MRDKEREDPWGKRDPSMGRALWERKCVSHILQSEGFFEPPGTLGKASGAGIEKKRLVLGQDDTI